MWLASGSSGARALNLNVFVRSHMLSCAVRLPSSAEAESEWLTLEEPLPTSRDVNQLGPALQALLESLQKALQARGLMPIAGREIHVLVGQRWLATTVLPWSDQLIKRGDAARAFARNGLQEAGYSSLSADDSICIDEAGYQEPCLAISYPAALLDHLQQFAQACSSRICTVRPLAVAAWRWAASADVDGRGIQREQERQLLVLDEEEVQLLHGQRCIADISWRIAPFGMRYALPDVLHLWRRWRFRACPSSLMAHAAHSVSVMDMRSRDGKNGGAAAELECLLAAEGEHLEKGQASQGTRMAGQTLRMLVPDEGMPAWIALVPKSGEVGLALDAVTMPGRLRRWASAASVVLVLAMTYLAVQVRDEHLRQQLVQIELDKVRSPTPSAKKIDRADATADRRNKAIAMAQQQLNMPFAELLTALHAPKDIQAAVLSIDTAIASNDERAARAGQVLHIVGQARSVQDMAQYLAYINGRTPLRSARLTHHELLNTADGSGVKFNVEATWTP